jgi:hypothetical protein
MIYEGPSFLVNGMVEEALAPTLTHNTMIIVSNTGDGSTVAIRRTWVTGDPAGACTALNVATVSNGPDAGGPNAGRAQRVGVSIVNNTQLLDQGGSVIVLRTNQRLWYSAAPDSMTGAQWNLIANAVEDHPERESMSASNFAKPQKLYCAPRDESFNDYKAWSGSHAANDFASHVAMWDSSTVRDYPMDSIYILFRPTPKTQSYVFTYNASWLCRFPLTTIMGQSQRPTPTASAEVINAGRRSAEAANHMHPHK